MEQQKIRGISVLERSFDEEQIEAFRQTTCADCEIVQHLIETTHDDAQTALGRKIRGEAPDPDCQPNYDYLKVVVFRVLRDQVKPVESESREVDSPPRGWLRRMLRLSDR